jgi:hypothetical protein
MQFNFINLELGGLILMEPRELVSFEGKDPA